MYVLNPNEDDLADTPIKDLNKLIELTVDNAVKHDSKTNCDEYSKISFVEKIEKLKPMTISIPSTASEEGEELSDRIQDNPCIRMINVLTDKNVIYEAAKVLINNKSNKVL